MPIKDYDKEMKRRNERQKPLSVGLAIFMGGAMALFGIQNRLSVPDMQKNEAQYLVKNRPDAQKACLTEQYRAFQAQYDGHDFGRQGPLNVTLDPNSTATVACTGKKAKETFDSTVAAKKYSIFYLEPLAAVFFGVAAMGLWDDRLRRRPRYTPPVQIPMPPPRNF